MKESQAESLVEFHCTKPEGVMIRSRDSLRYDDTAFEELIEAIEALEATYTKRDLIPRRIAACLANLPQEVTWTAERARREGDEDAFRQFQKASSRIWTATSHALWRGSD